jgi:hypothetical protein
MDLARVPDVAVEEPDGEVVPQPEEIPLRSALVMRPPRTSQKKLRIRSRSCRGTSTDE